jgi:hypothetical protein
VHSIEIIRTHRLELDKLIERTAPLAEGTQIVHELAKGNLDVVKVILYP